MENIFVNKLLFSLNILDFSLSLCKNCTPHHHPEKFHPYLSSSPHLKIVFMSSLPSPNFFFCCWKFGGRFNPPAEMERFTLCFPDIQYLIFGLQLCPINYKNCRSLNIKTHSFLGKVCHHSLKKINHSQWRHEVCPLNQFSCTKFNHLR